MCVQCIDSIHYRIGSTKTSPTNESIRSDPIQRIIQMSEGELNAAHSCILGLKTIKKEYQPPMRKYPRGALVSLESTGVSSTKTKNVIEKATMASNSLAIPQPIVSTYNLPPMTEKSIEICRGNSAIGDLAIDNNPSDFDSDATTEFEYLDPKKIVKCELPSDTDTNILEENIVEREVNRSSARDQNSKAGASMLTDTPAVQLDTKKGCPSPVDTSSAAGPACKQMIPSNNKTQNTKTRKSKKKVSAINEDYLWKSKRVRRNLADNCGREDHVYDSRISARFYKIMLSGLLKPQCSEGIQRFYQFCPFCEKKFRHTRFGWIGHLIMHTGEDRYKCEDCNVTVACKSSHLKKYKCSGEIRERFHDEGNASGYICNECNYTQLFEPDIIKHAKVLHGLNDPLLDKQYKKIQLIYLCPRDCGPMPRNYWKDMYPTSLIYSTFCVLCNDQNTVDLVDHYIKSHNNAEVFISRISSRMKDLALAQRENTMKPMLHLHAFAGYCLFCEATLELNKTDWWLHMKSHTSERNYTSVLPKYCCYGYMCLLCNFVQLSEKNVMAHVLNQHVGDVDLADISKNYVRLNLL